MKLSNGPLGVFPTWRATGVVRCCLLFVLTILPLGALDATGAPCVFVRGDIWGTAPGELAVLDFNDASYLLSFLDNTAPLNAERPECVDAGDVNDNGLVELSDVAYLTN